MPPTIMVDADWTVVEYAVAVLDVHIGCDGRCQGCFTAWDLNVSHPCHAAQWAARVVTADRAGQGGRR